jgi:hypothetical protein
MHPSNLVGGIAVVVVPVLVVVACVLLAGRDGENRKKEEEQRHLQGDYYGMMMRADRDEAVLGGP